MRSAPSIAGTFKDTVHKRFAGRVLIYNQSLVLVLCAEHHCLVATRLGRLEDALILCRSVDKELMVHIRASGEVNCQPAG